MLAELKSQESNHHYSRYICYQRRNSDDGARCVVHTVNFFPFYLYYAHPSYASIDLNVVSLW